jgi:hypothetical protein
MVLLLLYSVILYHARAVSALRMYTRARRRLCAHAIYTRARPIIDVQVLIIQVVVCFRSKHIRTGLHLRGMCSSTARSTGHAIRAAGVSRRSASLCSWCVIDGGCCCYGALWRARTCALIHATLSSTAVHTDVHILMLYNR